MALVASFAPSLRSGANDATRATNKQYALQKSSYCPIKIHNVSVFCEVMAFGSVFVLFLLIKFYSREKMAVISHSRT